MSERTPDPGPAFQVENRSDRVWVFGYLRMAPFLIFLTGIGLFAAFGRTAVSIPPAAGLGILFVFIVVPLFLNYSSVIDPVDRVVFGSGLWVKRLAGSQTWKLSRVGRVEFSEAPGADFDPLQHGRRWWVTVRIRLAWPSPRLLVGDAAARRIAAWAARHQLPVTGGPG